MTEFIHAGNPLSIGEWQALTRSTTIIGGSAISRRFIESTGESGPGTQTAPPTVAVAFGERVGRSLRADIDESSARGRRSQVVPLLWKDFVLHWRDVEEARLTGRLFSMAKPAAAAAACARQEERLVILGDEKRGYEGLYTVPGRLEIRGLRWSRAGDFFRGFLRIVQALRAGGHNGPFAAAVHPNLYSGMHGVLPGSNLLEVNHVFELLGAGIYRTTLLPPNGGLVIAVGRQNLELFVSIDTSVAYLGASHMNLPFRVFKAVYLRILRPDAICSF